MPKKEKPTRYEHVLVVEGRGDFPIDMLRYDSCAPSDEVDALRIQNAQRGTYRVKLRRFSVAVRPCTSERWLSFGWRVVYDSADPRFDHTNEVVK